ncbi:DUF1659 domain-containing protein [Clostridium sp. YIM B02506]|uniref:DUF1659 domain-containing protein n=1 Tax=Clostridium sp. YIM B02506 TaxID=2910680 RepID=UPI001EEF6724|nr:DUF1659 domain-containing protein [Clostridium sp. YIM B02506]
MSVEKVATSSQFTVEVENGVNKAGEKIYKKLNFSGLRPDYNVDALYELAEAIRGILSNDTRDALVFDVSKIVKKD